MIKLVLSFFVCLLVESSSAQHGSRNVSGILVASDPNHHESLSGARSFVGKKSANEVTFKCPAGSGSSYCADDCSTLLTCPLGAAERDPIVSLKCKTLLPSSPYCIPGKTKCSSVGDDAIAECKKTKIDFECTSVGYFPDPKNCSKFVYCGDTGAERYECPNAKYVYDTSIENCKSSNSSSDCVTIDCASQKKFPAFVVYSARKAFYATCTIQNGELKTIMGKCADTENFVFNTSTMNCDFYCKAAGKYPDPEDFKKYYECYCITSDCKEIVFNFDLKNCSTGSYFDKTTRKCKVGTCPSSNFNCKAVGIFPDPADCKKYYKCLGCTHPFKIHFNQYDYYCPTGSYFDKTTRKCKVGTCPFNCKAAGKYPDPADCKKYYECSCITSDCKASVFNFDLKNCPTGLYFDKTTRKCKKET